jgi:hypothetical protein
MDFNALLAKVPNSLLVGFATIGLLAVSSKVINYTRLLLSLFVLSGKNVRTPTLPNLPNMLTNCHSYGHMERRAPGQL